MIYNVLSGMLSLYTTDMFRLHNEREIVSVTNWLMRVYNDSEFVATTRRCVGGR